MYACALYMEDLIGVSFAPANTPDFNIHLIVVISLE
jgi:hypothetical protein